MFFQKDMFEGTFGKNVGKLWRGVALERNLLELADRNPGGRYCIWSGAESTFI